MVSDTSEAMKKEAAASEGSAHGAEGVRSPQVLRTSGPLPPSARTRLSPAQMAWRRLCLRHVPLEKVDRRLRALRDIERLRRTGAFDADWYAQRYPDAARSGLSPLAHYVRKGAWEGRRPRPDFDPLHYLSLHDDVAASGIEPFTHYLVYGRKEGRAAGQGATALHDLLARRKALDARAGPRGWYGSEPIASAAFYPYARGDVGPFGSGALAPPGGSDEGPVDWVMRLGPVDLLQNHIATRSVPSHAAPSPAAPAFTIITVFSGNRAGFGRTAAWLGALLAQETRHGEARLRILVLNDDPACTAEELEALLPPDLATATTLVCDGARRGIAARRNEAAGRAQGDFLLFLDPGQAIAPDALRVLAHYIAAFPHARFLSCAYLELDADGCPLARADRLLDASELPLRADAAGLPLAVRSDLLSEIGGFDARFEGAEMDALFLKAAMGEPVLAIPEPLLARPAGPLPPRAAARLKAARADGLREMVDALWPAQAPPARARPAVERGLCLVRTQGRRPDLLARALASIHEQDAPLTAAVIVHGDGATFERVRATAPAMEGRTVFLHAADTRRRRGHPWNAGLAYLEANRDLYQYLCFLDDDDIYYPLFARRMAEAFALTGADVVYALANRRAPGGASEPSHMPLPVSCLVAGNFIPTNAYAVRADLLADSGVRAPEDMDYFEDWYFLVSLLAAGARFHLLPEAVGEFLLIGDGNAPSKRDPAHHAFCLSRVLARGEKVAADLGLGRFHRDLVDFDFAAEATRHPSPGGHLILAKKQFLKAIP